MPSLNSLSNYFLSVINVVDRKRKRQLYGVHLWHCVTHHEGSEGVKWELLKISLFFYWDTGTAGNHNKTNGTGNGIWAKFGLGNCIYTHPPPLRTLHHAWKWEGGKEKEQNVVRVTFGKLLILFHKASREKFNFNRQDVTYQALKYLSKT